MHTRHPRTHIHEGAQIHPRTRRIRAPKKHSESLRRVEGRCTKQVPDTTSAFAHKLCLPVSPFHSPQHSTREGDSGDVSRGRRAYRDRHVVLRIGTRAPPSPNHTVFFLAPTQGSVQVGDGVPIRVALGFYEQLQIKAITRLHWHELVCHPCLCVCACVCVCVCVCIFTSHSAPIPESICTTAPCPCARSVK